MKANQKIALTTALLLCVTMLAACSTARQDPSDSVEIPKFDGIIESDGVIEGSFGTIAGQSLPEAAIPEKPEGYTALTDDNGFKELVHKIHTANSREAIFANHTSLSLTMDDTYKHPYDMSDYVYLGPDYSYGHASNYEQYSKDREVFQRVGIDTNKPYEVYIADLTENYRGHVYWYVPEKEEDFYDAEHETLTDVFTKDGILWQYSVMDETGSKNYIDNMMGGDYSGEIINCVELVNAENYEIAEGYVYAEKDGKTYLLGVHRMQYDLPEPEIVTSFLKRFDNGDKATATVTYVANPGKDNEISKSLIVPKYSAVTFYSQDIPEGDIFLDAECTKPMEKQWNGRSDITYYVVPKQ